MDKSDNRHTTASFGRHWQSRTSRTRSILSGGPTSVGKKVTCNPIYTLTHFPMNKFTILVPFTRMKLIPFIKMIPVSCPNAQMYYNVNWSNQYNCAQFNLATLSQYFPHSRETISSPTTIFKAFQSNLSI